MSNPFVSVIMSVYGVEDYIESGIKSIRAQSSSDWELIIVDDKTPDDSIVIARKYEEIDKRIKIYHHETNKGLSAARNTGIKHATGKYLWFMDPDDTVDDDLIEEVEESVKINPAKVVLFGLNEEYYKEDGEFVYDHHIVPIEENFNNKLALRPCVMELEKQTLFGYAWNKFYDREYILERGIKFETVYLIEDILFNIRVFRELDSLNLLGIAPYHYAKRGTGSLTNKFVPEYYALHRKRISELNKMLSYWNLETDENKELLGGLFARYILSALQRNCDKRSEMDRKQRKEFIYKVFIDKLYKKLIPYAKAKESTSLRIWIAILKSGKAMPCLAFGRIVNIIRNGSPMIYNMTKSER
ncbi:MAG: glycosyltransferase family 2 protein [Suipraeoptans sp.]